MNTSLDYILTGNLRLKVRDGDESTKVWRIFSKFWVIISQKTHHISLFACLKSDKIKRNKAILKKVRFNSHSVTNLSA